MLKFMNYEEIINSDYFTLLELDKFEKGKLPKSAPSSDSLDIGKIGIHYCENDEEYWIIGLHFIADSFYNYDDALDYLLKKLKNIS